MRKVKVLAFVLAAGVIAGSYATDARVAVMGRQSHPWFYKDEVTVFNNPADMSLYPNMLYGSFGWVNPEQRGSQITTENFNPNDPFFGAMFSYRFGEEDNSPMLSIGAFANRRDPMLNRLIEAGGRSSNGRTGPNTPNLIDPAGKFDLMLGYDLGNGVAFGAGAYAAVQNRVVGNTMMDQTEFYKGSLGMNWNIDQGLDLEASVNAGMMNARYHRTWPAGAPDTMIYVTDRDKFDYFLRGDLRFFSGVPAINGAFVPQVTLEYIKLNERDIIDLNGGVGVNMNIDRGFFWAGLQGVYTQINSDRRDIDDIQEIGARLSFGIERNVVWDWFLIRVGGAKELRFVTSGSDDTHWRENVASDGSELDLVGLGFGLNIDNRLRIDVVVSESLPYTLTNLITGNQHHLFSRVSATYRF